MESLGLSVYSITDKKLHSTPDFKLSQISLATPYLPLAQRTLLERGY